MSVRHPLGSHLLVGLQLVFVVLALYPFDGPERSGFWLGISLAGGIVGIYTLLHNRLGNFDIYPEPINNARLITSGPYRWVRHPMYLALILLVLGVAIYLGSLWNLLGVALLIAVLIGKMRREEAYLTQKFDEYAAYCRRSKRLMPHIF